MLTVLGALRVESVERVEFECDTSVPLSVSVSTRVLVLSV